MRFASMDFVRIGREVRSAYGKISIGEVLYVGNSDEKIGIEMLKVQFCVIFPILPEDGKSEGGMVDILRNKGNFLLKNTPPQSIN